MSVRQLFVLLNRAISVSGQLFLLVRVEGQLPVLRDRAVSVAVSQGGSNIPSSGRLQFSVHNVLAGTTQPGDWVSH